MVGADEDGRREREAAERERSRERRRAGARGLLLVRVRRPVEGIRPERALGEPEPERDGALSGVPPARDAEDPGRRLGVVAEARRLGAPPVHADRHGLGHAHGESRAALVEGLGPVGVAPLELHRGPSEVAAARHDVHGAPDRARAPHGRAGTGEDLDPLDGGHGDVEVEREMVALRVVDGLAVHEDEGPVEVAAADPDVRLHAARPAPPHVDAEHGAQDVRDGVGAGQRVDLLAGHDAHDGRLGRLREARGDDAHVAADLRRLVLFRCVLGGGVAGEGEREDRGGDPDARACLHAGEDSESGRPGFCG